MPPSSHCFLSPFSFSSPIAWGERGEGGEAGAGNPGLASLTEELSWLNLCSDSFVWFPWKLTKGTWWPEKSPAVHPKERDDYRLRSAKNTEVQLSGADESRLQLLLHRDFPKAEFNELKSTQLLLMMKQKSEVVLAIQVSTFDSHALVIQGGFINLGVFLMSNWLTFQSKGWMAETGIGTVLLCTGSVHKIQCNRRFHTCRISGEYATLHFQGFKDFCSAHKRTK